MEDFQISQAQAQIDNEAAFDDYVDQQKAHFRAELMTGATVKTVDGEVSVDDLVEEHGVAYALQQIEDIGRAA